MTDNRSGGAAKNTSQLPHWRPCGPVSTRGIVRTRLNRIAQGSFGDCEPIGQGVHELKIDYGPGYGIYFGEDGDEVILLGGGDKSTQASDIKKAKERWGDYNA